MLYVDFLNSFIAKDSTEQIFTRGNSDDHADTGNGEEVLKNETIIPEYSSAIEGAKALKPVAKASIALKQQLLQADLIEDRRMQAIALNFCKEAGWHNCVKTILICPNDDDVTMKQVKQKTRKVIAFEITGFAEVDYKLDEKLFKELLYSS